MGQISCSFNTAMMGGKGGHTDLHLESQCLQPPRNDLCKLKESGGGGGEGVAIQGREGTSNM